jgi:Asp-tRNA(Asn)/Glu-tRNA(Gln) amidotransferase B subunit
MTPNEINIPKVADELSKLYGVNQEEIQRDVAKAVAEWTKEQKKVLNFLTGEVMKASKGSANPKLVQEILQTLLSEL